MKLDRWINARTTTLALGLAALTFALSGCVVAVGDEGAKPFRPTLGQELTDLKKARDNGSITEDEYQAQRQRLMEERGKKQ
jgi:hypothetical protein